MLTEITIVNMYYVTGEKLGPNQDSEPEPSTYHVDTQPLSYQATWSSHQQLKLFTLKLAFMVTQTSSILK